MFGIHGDVRAADGAVVAAIGFDDLTAVTVANGAVSTDCLDREVSSYLFQ